MCVSEYPRLKSLAVLNPLRKLSADQLKTVLNSEIMNDGRLTRVSWQDEVEKELLGARECLKTEFAKAFDMDRLTWTKQAEQILLAEPNRNFRAAERMKLSGSIMALSYKSFLRLFEKELFSLLIGDRPTGSEEPVLSGFRDAYFLATSSLAASITSAIQSTSELQKMLEADITKKQNCSAASLGTLKNFECFWILFRNIAVNFRLLSRQFGCDAAVSEAREEAEAAQAISSLHSFDLSSRGEEPFSHRALLKGNGMISGSDRVFQRVDIINWCSKKATKRESIQDKKQSEDFKKCFATLAGHVSNPYRQPSDVKIDIKSCENLAVSLETCPVVLGTVGWPLPDQDPSAFKRAKLELASQNCLASGMFLSFRELLPEPTKYAENAKKQIAEERQVKSRLFQLASLTPDQVNAAAARTVRQHLLATPKDTETLGPIKEEDEGVREGEADDGQGQEEEQGQELKIQGANGPRLGLSAKAQ